MARTAVAPLERVRLLLQVDGISELPQSQRGKGTVDTIRKASGHAFTPPMPCPAGPLGKGRVHSPDRRMTELLRPLAPSRSCPGKVPLVSTEATWPT